MSHYFFQTRVLQNKTKALEDGDIFLKSK